MYVARVYVGGMMPTVENIEVADTDWVEANSRSVKDYVFVPYSSGEEVSLGAGTWIADGQNPPLNGHFVATQVLTASDQQLILMKRTAIRPPCPAGPTRQPVTR